MWMDFETKMRSLMMNMINPVMDMVTDDRIILNRVQDTNQDLVKRVSYLEDIVLYNKQKLITKAIANKEKAMSSLGSSDSDDSESNSTPRNRSISAEPSKQSLTSGNQTSMKEINPKTGEEPKTVFESIMVKVEDALA
jgi:hypothetical protein